MRSDNQRNYIQLHDSNKDAAAQLMIHQNICIFPSKTAAAHRAARKNL